MSGCRDCTRCTEAAVKSLVCLPFRLAWRLLFSWNIGVLLSGFVRHCPTCGHRMGLHQMVAGRFKDQRPNASITTFLQTTSSLVAIDGKTHQTQGEQHMHVMLQNDAGLTKEVKFGVSWTALFFSAFPFFFRGMPGHAILWLIIGESSVEIHGHLCSPYESAKRY